MMKILITGISGRMGQAVKQAIELNPAAEIAATHDVGQDIAAAMQAADITIDFSFHGFTPELLATAVAQGKPLVIGTTGHTAEEKAAISEAAKSIPIVFASNYSVGVNTLFWLTRKATRILKDYDIEIIEMHHHHKLDAPSGTARTLAEVVCEETGLDYEKDVMHGRNGLVGARPQAQIGMHSMRGGDVVGDHTVMYATDGERLELTHKASSRMTFSTGAVRAALWPADKPAGLYNMQDVLGFTD
ncbi:MAG: 4-hydroxy-tetrahydrodipicolinate reductase [Akkermansia sp.]|nr:4-hydroxy-tetrahydrodipicolinate reductase [Akkermansia sp.]